jgi:hypothetical protein
MLSLSKLLARIFERLGLLLHARCFDKLSMTFFYYPFIHLLNYLCNIRCQALAELAGGATPQVVAIGGEVGLAGVVEVGHAE